MNIITGYKGLYQPLIYAQHEERKQMIQTQSLQYHKLRQSYKVSLNSEFQRRLLGINWKDKVKNEEILKRITIEKFED